MIHHARAGTGKDIPFIMATERLPGYDAFIGRWDEGRHAQEMADPRSAYVIAEADGAPVGFAILQHLDDPFGNVLLKRIAVDAPGAGTGRFLLRRLMADVFARETAHRFHLDVLVSNERARHAYRRVGFQEEGVMREIYFRPDGTRVSAALMSILRPEWLARQNENVWP